jgi:cellulose synthase/poly-beta-1,6-N-acetylglucosamine synthase-like glycosyltransferase
MADTILTILFWFCFGATAYTYFLYPLLLWILTRFVSPESLKASNKTTVLHVCHSEQSEESRFVGGGETLRSAQGDKREVLLEALNNSDISGPIEKDLKRADRNSDMPSVTMVISAYNEQDVLPDKIRNCREIEYPPEKLTFLIGSDGSSDGTGRILSAIEDDRFQVVINPDRHGKVQMLNCLMNSVSSEIVVFSDANTMYQPDAIQELVKKFQHPSVGAVIGKLELSVPAHEANACQTEGMYWRYENRLKEMESALGAVPTINGGIFAIRRELYEELPAQAVTEDQVLGMKIMSRRFRCLFAQRACARETVSTWQGELRRRIRISAGNFQSLFLVPAILHPRLGWVSFAFISHKLLRWLVPFFLVGMLWTNLLLAGQMFYGSTLLLQGLFYISGLMGAILPKVGGVVSKTFVFKILSIPKYFLLMNFAILLGCARFIFRRQQVTWAKTQR